MALTPHGAPSFVGGCGASGTTWVVDLLGLHPRLSPVYETDFVLSLGAALFPAVGPPSIDRLRPLMATWAAALPHRPHTKRSHERYHHGPHHIRFTRAQAMAAVDALVDDIEPLGVGPAFRRLLEALFAHQCAADRKPRWINKTPAYVQALPLLAHVMPELRFVHVVRDVRAVVASVLARPWGPADAASAAAWWARTQ